MPKKNKQRAGQNGAENNFAKDVELATEPIMDRARQIKEEVSQATNDLKNNLDKNNEVIRDKTERLMDAGDKFTREAIDILRPEPVQESSGPFALRGKKLYLVLGGIILLAILAVLGKKL